MERGLGQAISENLGDDIDENLDQRGYRVTTDVWKDVGILYRL